MWLRRITEVDENDLYDFMVIDAQQKNASKLSFFSLLHSMRGTACRIHLTEYVLHCGNQRTSILFVWLTVSNTSDNNLQG